MIKSLGGKLVISYVALTTVTIIVFSSLAYWALTRAARQQEITYLSDSAQTVALQARPMIESDFSDQELERLSQAASFFTNVRVRILDNQDRTLADSGMPFESRQVVLFGPGISAGTYPRDDELTDVIIGLENSSGTNLPIPISPFSGTVSTSLFVRRMDEPWGSSFVLQAPDSMEGQVMTLNAQATSSPLSHSEQIIYAQIGDPSNPVGTVQFIASNNPGTRVIEPILRAFLLAGAGTILLAVLLGLLIGRQLSAPLATLSETAARMAAGDLSARTVVTTNDEIGALATRFNGMADQLQASFAELAAERDALRRFIEDASHELRTPITALKNFIDLLLGPAAGDTQAQLEFLQESQVQIVRLQTITSALLDLSRLDAGLAALEMEEVEISDLMEQVVASYRLAAQDKSIVISIEPPWTPLTTWLDRRRTEIALHNLLDNAIHLTPLGGQIRFSFWQDTAGKHLAIEDNGPGVHPDDAVHLFTRFYRGHNIQHAGHGLGLAISRANLQAQGGDVRLDREFSAGARFVVDLPGK